MGMVAAIQRQSRRSYIYSQISLGWALAASSAIAVMRPGDPQMLFPALLSTGAIASSMFALHHARRGLYTQLARARDFDEERQRLLETDAMTGALTRRYFLEALETSLKRKMSGATTTLILIDIDHFKQLNDSLGHPAGDAALAHVVKCLAHSFPGGVIGRLGGDEFGVKLDDTATAECKTRIAQFMNTLREPLRRDGQHIALSVSMGTACFPEHAYDSASLIHNADMALYASKVAGRSRSTVFEAEMLTDRKHVRYMERELRAAVYLNELELHYQPVVDCNGETQALEGLVRWRHPVRGMIPPGEFVPIAERSTLIDLLGEWVFRRACLDIPRFGGRRVTINISGEQLKRDAIVAMTTRVLRETGRRADEFVLEITETMATDATADVLRRLESLRVMGFLIALDDFGTGHCGFNYLKTLPVDCIKIDRSYIRNLREDRVAQVLVSALAEIGRLQNILIVAEGIETEEDFALARAAGCDRFQGYLLCRPKPRDQLPDLTFDVATPEPARLSA